MSAKPILGQTAEIPGPKKALIFSKPEIAASMIKKAKRVILVVGSEAVNVKTKDGCLIDSAIILSKARNVTVLATGHMLSEFMKRNAENVYSMSLTSIGDRLRYSDWSGLDGKGPYDLAVFMGFYYYMEWLVLSGLKNFAPELRTISLDNVYQPNASWSFGSMSDKDWMESLDKIVSIMEEAD